MKKFNLRKFSLKEFLIRKIRDVRGDVVQYSSILLAPVIAFLYYTAYVQTADVSCIVRAWFFLGYPLFVVLLGRKGVFAQMILYASIIQAFIPYNNFTAFFITLISARMYRKWEIPAIVLYIIAANMTLAFQGDSAVHISIHLFCCIFFYMIYFIMGRAIEKRVLRLRKDERKVLQALSDGFTQDCVDGYSKSTVARILKDCKARNCCRSTSELMEMFESQR